MRVAHEDGLDIVLRDSVLAARFDDQVRAGIETGGTIHATVKAVRSAVNARLLVTFGADQLSGRLDGRRRRNDAGPSLTWAVLSSQGWARSASPATLMLVVRGR